MPDPVSTLSVTTVIASGAVVVSQDLLRRLLGPTFDYLGDSLKDYAKKRVETVGRIFLNGEKKLGNRLNTPGQVSPRVLRTILDEGSFSDNFIAVEYFGGVLASARTEVGRDDRGARIAKMIDSLSTYQLRTHFLIYSSISTLFSKDVNSFSTNEDRAKMQLYMPLEGFFNCMEFSIQEWNEGQIMNHILHGLLVDGLIESRWGFGSQETLRTLYSRVPGAGMVCTPSALGAELFLWAFGHGDKPNEFILEPSFAPEIEGVTGLVTGTVGTRSPTVQDSEQPPKVE